MNEHEHHHQNHIIVTIFSTFFCLSSPVVLDHHKCQGGHKKALWCLLSLYLASPLSTIVLSPFLVILLPLLMVSLFITLTFYAPTSSQRHLSPSRDDTVTQTYIIAAASLHTVIYNASKLTMCVHLQASEEEKEKVWPIKEAVVAEASIGHLSLTFTSNNRIWVLFSVFNVCSVFAHFNTICLLYLNFCSLTFALSKICRTGHSNGSPPSPATLKWWTFF